MNKIERFQQALAEFSRATTAITGVKLTHIYVDDTDPITKSGDNPFRLVLEGVKINHGKGN